MGKITVLYVLYCNHPAETEMTKGYVEKMERYMKSEHEGLPIKCHEEGREEEDYLNLNVSHIRSTYDDKGNRR
jgi:hypothetical protein